MLAAVEMAVTTTSSTPRPSRPTTMTESSAALTESEPANEVSVIQVATVRFKNVKSVSDWLGLPREILLLNLT